MSEKKEITINEANRFHVHRAQIAKISRRNGVDVAVAARMLAMAMAWTGYTDELREFENYVADRQAKTTPKANLVLKYFGGEQ